MAVTYKASFGKVAHIFDPWFGAIGQNKFILKVDIFHIVLKGMKKLSKTVPYWSKNSNQSYRAA